MPTYDYVCRACEHEFELFQQMSAPVKKKCPECGALKLERLIGTGAGVIFKGSGFYQTDYRSDSYKKAAEADTKPSDTKADGKSDGKADGKSEGKADGAAKDAKSKDAKSKDGAAKPDTPAKSPDKKPKASGKKSPPAE